MILCWTPTSREHSIPVKRSVHYRGSINYVPTKEEEQSLISVLSFQNGVIFNIGQTNYAASEGGLVGLTRALAKEMAFHSTRIQRHSEISHDWGVIRVNDTTRFC
jgi:NAD(P)-dependent dehydrogenase (short-subunit alcohol dehydrogenase family)